MVKKYLVTFDLKDGKGSSYERLHEWVHRIGGYRYFRFKSGRCGRLSVHDYRDSPLGFELRGRPRPVPADAGEGELQAHSHHRR